MHWSRSIILSPSPRRIQYAIILIGVVITPAYSVLQLVQRYAVNVPFHDTWTLWLYDYVMLPYMSFSDALSTMWILQNEHRIFLPRLIQLPLAHLTNLYLPAIMFLSLVVLMLVLAVLVRALWKTTHNTYVKIVCAAGLSAMTFALTASDRYINENAFPIFLAVLMSVLSLYTLSGSDKPGGRPWVSLAAAIAAALSFSSGYVTLLIGFLYLLFVRRALRSRVFLAWIAVSVLLVGLYLLELIPKLQFIGESTVSMDVRTIFLSVLRQIGSPLSPAWPVPAIFGLVPVLIFAALAIPILLRSRNRQQDRPELFWVMLGLWALLTTLLAAFGRSGVQGDGTPTRYFIYGQVFQIALVMTAVQSHTITFQLWSLEKHLKPVILAAALLFPTGTYAFALAHFDFHSEFRIERNFLSLGYNCLRAGSVSVEDLDCIRPLFFNTLTVNLMAPYVYHRGISTLREAGSTADLIHVLDEERRDQYVAEIPSYSSNPFVPVIQALSATPGVPLTWNLTIPPNADVHFEATLRRSRDSNDMSAAQSVTFEVLVIEEEGPTDALLLETLTAETPQEVPVSVDLSAYAGREVALVLQASASSLADGISAYWIEPRLVGTAADRTSVLLTLPADLIAGETRPIQLPEGYRTYDHGEVRPFNYQQIAISTSLRSAIEVQHHEEISWRFHIPPASHLSFRTELYAPPQETTDSVPYSAEIEIRAGYSVTQIMYSEIIQRSFEPVLLEFDLSQYAGVLPSSPLESVVITLRVVNREEESQPQSETDALSHLFWVEPTLIHSVPALLAAETPDNVILVRH